MSIARETKITSNGIKKSLQQCTPERAIAEYIWNGFDAGASSVQVGFNRQHPDLDIIDGFYIEDNGSGIPLEKLNEKFEPYLESAKSKDKNKRIRTSENQGNDGQGRLTFFTFCESATWQTVYEKDKKRFSYSIKINSASLNKFEPTDSEQCSDKKGTAVCFEQIHHDFTAHYCETKVLEYLKKEFGWFLELNRNKEFKITINGKTLDFSSMVSDREDFNVYHAESKASFSVRFIQWKKHLHEYSRFYFLNSEHQEKFKEPSKLNNKGDNFYHSVFVTSNYFDSLSVIGNTEDNQPHLDFAGKPHEPLEFLRKKLNEFLIKRRKKLLKLFSFELIEEYEREGVFPRLDKSVYEFHRKDDLKNVVKSLYEADPRVFQDLNLQQKKTFVGFLNLLLDTDERERILNILKECINLDEEDQKNLINLLKVTKLNRIINTVRLVEDRYRAVNLIRELALNRALKANEVKDLQEAIQNHYWLFGEQYHLVTAAEPDFDEALRRFKYILTEKDEKVTIDHPDHQREMDIFCVRQNISTDTVESIVVELKHPDITLGSTQLQQVKEYMSVILKHPDFNGSNRLWKFILVGKNYNSDIEGEIQNSKNHGKPSLVYKVGNYEIYVKKWDEVFTNFECRHKFINDKLQLERKALIVKQKNKEQIGDELKQNLAKSPDEITTKTDLKLSFPNSKLSISTSRQET